MDKKKPEAAEPESIVIIDPRSRRRFEVKPRCNCGHMYSDHIKDGQVRSCSKCHCPAFNSIKVIREVTGKPQGLGTSLALIFMVYLLSTIVAAIWWLLFQEVLMIMGRFGG